jgi:transposase-like protein
MKNCPRCNSENTIKNGSIHNGKPKFMCKDCRHQFVENPTKKVITDDMWKLVDKLLLEKIPISGISEYLTWATNFKNHNQLLII